MFTLGGSQPAWEKSLQAYLNGNKKWAWCMPIIPAVGNLKQDDYGLGRSEQKSKTLRPK
jgi:hypothetical protein